MGDQAQSEAARLRVQLADAESRIETLRRQQVEAKSKAKALIQKQRAQAADAAAALEGENKRQAEELDAVKSLLRDADADKDRLLLEKEDLRSLVDRGKGDFEKLLGEREEVERKLETATRVKDAMEEKACAETSELEKRLAHLEEELRDEREKSASATVSEVDSAVRSTGNGILSEANDSTLRVELEQAKDQIVKLEATCDKLRKEGAVVMGNSQVQGSESRGENGTEGIMSEQPMGEIWVEVRQAKERAEELAQELDTTRGEMEAQRLEHEKRISELVVEKMSMQESLSISERLVTQLKADLEKSEIALQEERENVVIARQSVSNASTYGDDGTKILEAKVAEMERLVALKQADIVKVREKARTYLKDINAEKREMEEKMKGEVEALRKEVEEEQEKVRLAEHRADSSTSELDSCLALIREKQKSVQMLRMTVSTEKKAAEEAKRVTESLRAEFAGYKERARVALQERESAAGASEAAVETATSSIRDELEKARKEVLQLRRIATSAKESEAKMSALMERVERAEAAADLLRKDTTGVSATNYSQIDVLEEKAMKLESELRMARTAAEDAEARHETTKMRLEAAERALRAAEIRTEEAGRLSNKSIQGLRKQVENLEKALERAQESSAAAQRTAAAAAKALAFTVPADDEDAKTTPKSSPQRSSGDSPNLSADISPYSSGANLSAGRSSFAAAMEGHTGSLGLRTRSADIQANENNGLSDADLIARDQQITVLTTQVAELGALLDDAQQETNLRSEQTALLKAEVKNLDAKLAAAEKLQNGAPFSYLRTIVVRYLETDDPTLLPVVANVLSFTEEEAKRIKDCRGSSSATSLSGASQKSGYFALPFLGSR